LYSRKNDFDKALPCFAKAIELAPNDAAAAFLLAYAQERSGKKSEAVARYRRVIEHQPDNSPALSEGSPGFSPIESTLTGPSGTDPIRA